MKLIKCVRAFAAIQNLMEKECSFGDAYKLLRVRNNLMPKAEFFANEEMGIVKKYAVKDESGNVKFTDVGKFEFISEEAAHKYSKDMESLHNVDVEDSNPVSISAPPSITPAAIEALEGIISFQEEE